jgi:hypothetical protein
MSEGPGRYYHPGMFPIIDSVLGRRDLAPGTYDLWKLAPLNECDPSVKAGIMHYSTDLGSSERQSDAGPWRRRGAAFRFPCQSKPAAQRRRRLDSFDGGRRSHEPDAAATKHGWGFGRQSDAAKAAAAVGFLWFAVGASVVSLSDQILLYPRELR